MLPSNAIVRGCLRWIRLLHTSSFSQAWLILRSDPEYADLTQGQYQVALELLKSIGALNSHSQTWLLTEQFRLLSEPQIAKVFYEEVIEHIAPAWLQDSDLLVTDSSDIPEDATKLAAALGLTELESFGAIRNVHARIDLAIRKQIGDAGEVELIHFLEQYWPGSTVHVASLGDGFGYDVAFRYANHEWHLEVKSTTRRGRMNIHLSRNEYEESIRDPNWRLIVVGLDQRLKLMSIATLRPGHLETFAPSDTSTKARWQNAAFEMAADNLKRGICLYDEMAEQIALPESLQPASACPDTWFEWLPQT